MRHKTRPAKVRTYLYEVYLLDNRAVVSLEQSASRLRAGEFVRRLPDGSVGPTWTINNTVGWAARSTTMAKWTREMGGAIPVTWDDSPLRPAARR